MLCNYCGNQNDDDALVCSNCKKDLNKTQESINKPILNDKIDENYPKEEIREQASNETSQADFQEQNIPAFVTNEIPANESNQAFDVFNTIINTQNEQAVIAKKKFPLALIISLSATVIVAVMAILTFIFWPKLVLNFSNPQKYYLKSEGEVILANAKTVINENVSQQKPFSVNGNYKVSFNSNNQQNFPKEAIDMFNKFSISFAGQSYDKDTLYNDLSVKFDNNDLLKILYEIKDSKTSISFPEYSNGEIVTSLNSILKGIEENGDISSITGLSKIELFNLCNEYIEEVLIANIPKENIKKTNQVIDGQKYKVHSFNINNEVYKKIMLALSEKIKSEKTVTLLKTTAKNLKELESLNKQGDIANVKIKVPTENEVEKQLNDYSDKLKKEVENLKDTVNTDFEVYYNSSGKLIKRTLVDNVNPNKISITNDEDGIINEVKFDLTDDKNESMILALKKYSQDKKDIINLNWLMKAEGKDQGIDLILSKRNETILNNVVELIDIDLNMKLDIEGENAVIKVTAQNTAEKDKLNQMFKVDFNVGTEKMEIGLNGGVTYSDKVTSKEISIPDKTTFDDSVMANISQGVQQKLMQILMAGFIQG